jgi:chromosome segregation ATPase
MKPIYIPILLLLIFFQSCGLNEREKNLKKLQQETAQKEQELLAWEQRLKLKEQELDHIKLSLDSAKKQIDSIGVHNPALIGKWTVKMNCTETTCEGSALGDTKTEQWEMSYKDSNVIVKAYAGPVLIRVYIGSYKNDVLKIVDEKPNSGALISATLNFTGAEKMEGSREIQQKDCKIVYALNARKLK